MSVPSLLSVCTRELVEQKKLHELHSDHLSVAFRSFGCLPDLFFKAAEQLNLKRPEHKNLYLQQIRAYLETYKPESRAHMRAIIDKIWLSGAMQTVSSLNSAKNKQTCWRWCLNIGHATFGTGWVFSAFFSAHMIFWKSMQSFIFLLTKGTYLTGLSRAYAFVECWPLRKRNPDEIDALTTWEGIKEFSTIFIAIPAVCGAVSYLLSRKLKNMSEESLKDQLTDRLTELFAEMVREDRVIDIDQDRAIFSIIKG